jgi:hypothetical protein
LLSRTDLILNPELKDQCEVVFDSVALPQDSSVYVGRYLPKHDLPSAQDLSRFSLLVASAVWPHGACVTIQSMPATLHAIHLLFDVLSGRRAPQIKETFALCGWKHDMTSSNYSHVSRLPYSMWPTKWIGTVRQLLDTSTSKNLWETTRVAVWQPLGLGHIGNMMVADLNKSQVQVLGCVWAMLRRPQASLIILDHPTQHLSIDQIQQLATVCRTLWIRLLGENPRRVLVVADTSDVFRTAMSTHTLYVTSEQFERYALVSDQQDNHLLGANNWAITPFSFPLNHLLLPKDRDGATLLADNRYIDANAHSDRTRHFQALSMALSRLIESIFFSGPGDDDGDDDHEHVLSYLRMKSMRSQQWSDEAILELVDAIVWHPLLPSHEQYQAHWHLLRKLASYSSVTLFASALQRMPHVYYNAMITSAFKHAAQNGRDDMYRYLWTHYRDKLEDADLPATAKWHVTEACGRHHAHMIPVLLELYTELIDTQSLIRDCLVKAATTDNLPMCQLLVSQYGADNLVDAAAHVYGFHESAPACIALLQFFQDQLAATQQVFPAKRVLLHLCYKAKPKVLLWLLTTYKDILDTPEIIREAFAEVRERLANSLAPPLTPIKCP